MAEIPPCKSITEILSRRELDNGEVAERLFPIHYDQLRELATHQLRDERRTASIQPTLLVHEAFLRLVDGDMQWDSRAHFFGSAARAMRQILVDHARQRMAVKRGGDRQREFVDLSHVASDPVSCNQLLALDEALEALEAIDQRKAKVISLRFFAGLTIEETAQALGMAVTTVKEDWRFARAWLRRRIQRDTETDL